MRDYTSAAEKLILSPRMERVYRQILPRLKPWQQREMTYCSELEPEGKNPFLDVFLENPDAPYVINLANAIVRSWLVTPVVIHPDEALVGITRPAYPFMEHFSWGIVCNGYRAEDHWGAAQLEAVGDAILRMTQLDEDHRYRAAEPVFGPNVRLFADEGLFIAGGYQGHTVPNYNTLLDFGLDGVLEKVRLCKARNAKDGQTQDLCTAWELLVQGMSRYLEQYAGEAARLAQTESNDEQRRYYLQIAENCSFVAHKKPRTLYQAVQLMWCLSLWDWVDCLGRVDQYLYPFYLKAKAEPDAVSAEDCIASIMFKLWENGAHNATVSGGKPEDGTDATNELTFLFLQMLRRIHEVYPRMAVRIREDIDPRLLQLILQIWSEGMCDPSIVSDTCVIPALQKLGVSPEDAQNYATLGCQEIEVPGKSNLGCEDGLFNVAKALEIAMAGGMLNGRRLGPETKTFLECETFEELYGSFETQLRYFIPIFSFIANRGQEERAANHAKLLKGIFTDGCLERGIDHDAGGPIYGYGVVETAGIAPAADSLTAIKKLVFEQKRISKERLQQALEANFRGFEKERQMLLNFAPKFGNDDEEADAMACRVLNTFWDEIAKYRSVRGGPFTGACSLLTAGVALGEKMGAMADGRFAGEPLGNTMGPRPGADRQGLTAMLASVAKLPLDKGVGGTTLNVTLSKKFLSDDRRRDAVAQTLKHYMCSGGQLAQVTTADLQDLQDAGLHPERHGDLIVRVGGFSTQFVSLSDDIQNEIISRYAAENL